MKKITTEILEIIPETPDVKTFRLKNSDHLTFIPGQYCLVSIPNHPTFSQLTRPFTFSNSPTEERFLELTIKEMGEFTKTLFQLKPGQNLQLKGPLGENLNFSEKISEDIVFLTGGSGITPFISTLRYAHAKKLPNHFSLLFGNRTEQDIIYAKELTALSKHPNFQVVHILEQPPNPWNGETGRIRREIVEKYISPIQAKLWYLCGPPGMMSAMKNLLQSLEIPKELWRIEPWEAPGKHN